MSTLKKYYLKKKIKVQKKINLYPKKEIKDIK